MKKFFLFLKVGVIMVFLVFWFLIVIVPWWKDSFKPVDPVQLELKVWIPEQGTMLPYPAEGDSLMLLSESLLGNRETVDTSIETLKAMSSGNEHEVVVIPSRDKGGFAILYFMKVGDVMFRSTVPATKLAPFNKEVADVPLVPQLMKVEGDVVSLEYHKIITPIANVLGGMFTASLFCLAVSLLAHI